MYVYTPQNQTKSIFADGFRVMIIFFVLKNKEVTTRHPRDYRTARMHFRL